MEHELFKDKIILCGPYVGSFEYEILHFKPFVDWLLKNFNFPNIIVSTHYNREFLYDIDNISIFKQYSKNEQSQYEHKNTKLSAKEYNYLINEIKECINKKYNMSKSNICIYNLNYNKTPDIINFQKTFTKLFNYENKTDSIIFIPDISRSKKELNKVYNYICSLTDDVEIIGDYKTHLNQYNHILNIEGYENYVYEIILGKLSTCKCVICPASFWTHICNLHKIPVYSWGNSENIISYKSVYNFGNKDCRLLPVSEKKNIDNIYKGINKFLKELNIC